MDPFSQVSHDGCDLGVALLDRGVFDAPNMGIISISWVHMGPPFLSFMGLWLVSNDLIMNVGKTCNATKHPQFHHDGIKHSQSWVVHMALFQPH